jgi:hypothetical protein
MFVPFVPEPGHFSPPWTLDPPQCGRGGDRWQRERPCGVVPAFDIEGVQDDHCAKPSAGSAAGPFSVALVLR